MRVLQQTFSITVNQIKEYRMTLLAAAGMSLLPIIARQVNFLGYKADEVYTVLAVIGTSLVLGIAGLMGLGMFGRDYAERRIGFYLTRPIGGMSLWLGKVAAALGIAFVAAVVVLTANLLALGKLTSFSKVLSDPYFNSVMLAVVGLVGLGGAAGIAFRSKSKLLLLDIALAPITIYWLAKLVWKIEIIGTGYHYRWNYINDKSFWDKSSFLPEFFLAFVLLTVIVTSMPLMYAGTDIKRAHKMMSLSFWSALTAILLGISGYGYYYLSVTPQDLQVINPDSIQPAPQGHWAYVGGSGNGFKADAAFLFNTATKQYHQVDNYQVTFSHDGNQAVWITYIPGFNGFDAYLNLLDLRQPQTQPRRLNYNAENLKGTPSLMFSPDNTKLVITDNDSASFYDLVSNRLLADVEYVPESDTRIKSARWMRAMHFINDHKVRLYRAHNNVAVDQPEMQIEEIDFATEYVGVVSTVNTRINGIDPRSKTFSSVTPHMSVSKDGKYFLTDSELVVRLHDGRTGEVLLTVDEVADDEINKQSDKRLNAQFLGNDRVMVCEYTQNDGARKTTVRIFNLAGELEKEIALGKGVFLLGNEVAPNILLLERSERSFGGITNNKVYLLDIAQGQLSEKITGAALVSKYSPYINHRETAPQSLGARLIHTKDGKIGYLDITTGQSQTVTGIGAN
jgi:hypothetical protein